MLPVLTAHTDTHEECCFSLLNLFGFLSVFLFFFFLTDTSFGHHHEDFDEPYSGESLTCELTDKNLPHLVKFLFRVVSDHRASDRKDVGPIFDYHKC